MLTKEEPVFNLIKMQKDCEFSLRFILQRANELWKSYFAMIKLVKKGTRKEISHDYGEYVVGEKLLGIEKGLTLIMDASTKNGEKGKFVIPDYSEFTIESSQEFTSVPSKSRYGYIRNDWASRFCELRIEQGRTTQNWNRELLREGLPYYPDLNEVVRHFFDLTSDNLSTHNEVFVVIPDYRAKIESLRLLLSKVVVQLLSPEIEYKNLALKVYARAGSKIFSPPDIYPDSDLIEFDIGFQPDILSVVLLSREDNTRIDLKEVQKWKGEEEGIFIERTEEEVLSLSRAGESQNLEYKYDIIDDDNKNDFIESVVAFLNTNRGIILVGVDDKGNIVGSKKSAEDIQKSIHDSCEPPPRNIKVEEKMVDEKKVILVEVPEGEDKPYQSKRDKNWYVRHNSNDMMIERSEMFQLLQKYTPQSSNY